MAASDLADSAIEAHLAAHWSAAPLFFENEPDMPGSDLEAWVYVENESFVTAQASVGAGAEAGGDLWRERGELTLHVLVPAGRGTKQGRVLRDQLAALFMRENAQIGPVRFLDVRKTGGLRWEGEANGNWWAMPLRIEWQADHSV